MKQNSDKIARNYEVVLRFRKSHFDPIGRRILDSVENRVCENANNDVLERLPKLSAGRIRSAKIAAEYGTLGQLRSDGMGGFWILTHENLFGKMLLHFDENIRLIESHPIRGTSGLLLYMDDFIPCWFDAQKLCLTRLDGVTVLDLSEQKKCLGEFVVPLRLIKTSHDNFAGIFDSLDQQSRAVFHLSGAASKLFVPDDIKLIQDMVQSQGKMILLEHETATLFILDIEMGSVSPALGLPLSCLGMGLTPGRDGRIWCLVNYGLRLVMLRNFKPASTLHLDGLGSLSGYVTSTPNFMDLEEKGGKARLFLTDMHNNLIHLVEFTYDI